MALANFTDLKSAVASWMARGDVSGQAEDFISLAEAALNRELNPVETDTALTGTVASRTIDISGKACVEAMALFIVPVGERERPLKRMMDGTFPYYPDNGCPRIWSIDGDSIDFDCPLDQAYSFRLRFRQKFTLSEETPTNWLLTNHPDVYLAAVLVWGGVFTRNSPFAVMHKTVLDQALPSVRSIIAQKNRSTLTIDPAISRMCR